MSNGSRRVLDLVLKSGGMSQADITRRLDLAQPTVTRLIQGFQKDGLIQIAARQTDGPGHPSVQVMLNPEFAYSFGVAMLGDVVSVTLMDFAGKVRGHRRKPMRAMTRNAVIEQIRLFMAELIAGTSIDKRRIVGIGVGISGFYIDASRKFNAPATLDEWALVDIEPILAEALEFPVVADNSGTVAAIGESLFGVGRRCSNFAYLHLTNGFGGGIIVDGRPLRGSHGNAGEFGGIWASNEVTYANLDLLQNCLREGGHPFATVEEMVQVIDLDWPGVDVWLDLAAPSFGFLSGILTYVLDPELIVIGGQLPSRIAQALVSRVVVTLAPGRRGYPLPTAPVVAAEAPGEPVSLGAAAMPLQAAFFV